MRAYITALLVLTGAMLLADGVQPAGSGTQADPWQVATLDNLLWVSTTFTSWDDHFIQTADIDAGDTENWNDGTGWNPIGSLSHENLIYPFTGTYNANEHTVANLWINHPDSLAQGFFGYTDNANISNLSLTNIYIVGSTYVGGVVGMARDSTNIYNCHTSGTICGEYEVGGIVGYAYRGILVEYSTNIASVDGETCGGIVGGLYWSSIVDCLSAGNITGYDFTGGLVGYMDESYVQNSYYNMDIVTINGSGCSTLGALPSDLYIPWLVNGLSLDIDDYLTQDGDVYLINSIDDFRTLYAFGQGGYHYKLTTNLDMSLNRNLHIPYFTGTFDGDYHAVYHFSIHTDSEQQSFGVFDYACNAAIMNLGVVDVDLEGYASMGALVGSCHQTCLTNCFSSGEVTGRSSTGGLVGTSTYGSVMQYCASSCTVSGSVNTSGFGGLIGYCRGTTLEYCMSTGDVSASTQVGGLLGPSENTTLSNCYCTGNVSGYRVIGGLVSNIVGGIIDCCYCTGEVTGGEYTGGLTGWADEATTNNSFWDIEASGQTSSAAGNGLSTRNMRRMYTYQFYGWDFMGEDFDGDEDIWGINPEVNNGYPFLSWEGSTHQPIPDGVQPSGAGTEESPWQVATLDNLLWLSTTPASWGGYWEQTADINAAETRQWNDGRGYYPIGIETKPFSGHYNARGHTVDSLFIAHLERDSQGFFAYTGHAYISNLGIINAEIHSTNTIGCLVGVCDSTTIVNCFSSGIIKGEFNTGGLVGTMSHSNLQTSFSEGEVCGGFRSGGLIATSSASTICDCYSKCNVSGVFRLGGLIGSIEDETAVEHCYSTGCVAGMGSYIGGLVGYCDGPVTNSFWNTETSGQTASAGGTGLTTAQMQDMGTYLDAGWDFVGEPANGTDDIWDFDNELNDGYPYLTTLPVGIGGSDDTQPNEQAQTRLLPAYPNPFNPSTTVAFSLPQAAQTELAVYNIRGQRVCTLVNDHLAAGDHSVQWNGTDDAGRAVSSGVYFCRLQAGGNTRVGRMVLLK